MKIEIIRESSVQKAAIGLSYEVISFHIRR